MKQIQAAIFDVDGTLFDYKEKKIHLSSITAIKRLKASGVMVVIASGRSFPLLGDECRSQIPADYYVLSNGHSILDAKGRQVFSKRFTYQHTQRVVELTRRYGNGLMLKYDTHSCIYSRREEMIQVFGKIGLDPSSFTYCPKMNYHEKELPMGFTIRGGRQIKEALAKQGDVYRVELFHDVAECDIFSPDTNKMTALSQLAKSLSIDPKQCIAFGDSLNDMEMIRWAGLGIAMGNACDQLKAVADQICPPSWEHGIGRTIDSLLPLFPQNMACPPIPPCPAATG